MVDFPFWRLGKRGLKRHEIDREIFRQDLESYRIVREAYCEYHRIDWDSLSQRQRRKYANYLKRILTNFPNLLRNGNNEAIFIQNKIIERAPNRASNVIPEALKFLDYLMRKQHTIRTPQYVEGERERALPNPSQPRALPNPSPQPPLDEEYYPVGTVEGRVVDENGNPVSGALVTIISLIGPVGMPLAPPRRRFVYRGVTDGNGNFFIPNVRASLRPWEISRPWESARIAQRYRVIVRVEVFDEVARGGTPPSPRRVQARGLVVVRAGERNRVEPDPIVIRLGRRSREEEIQEYYDTLTAERPVRFRGLPRSVRRLPVGRLTIPSRAISRRLRSTGFTLRHIIFTLFLIVIGIIIAAITGNYWFMAGFIFMALYYIFPDPGEIELLDNVIEHDTGQLRFSGSLWGNVANRTTTSIALLRAIGEMGWIVCFTIGIYRQQFPLSNLILLIFVFYSYFRLPIEFEPTRPYDFIRSAFRFIFLVPFMAFFIFGAFGGGIFRSQELGWLTLAFFAVWPIARERRNLARALGLLGSGSGEAYEVIDRIIFVVIMLIFAIGYGFSFAGGGFFRGSTSAIIFSAVWVLGLVTGLTTPPETRPWMGIIILGVGFVVFGFGAGQQAMGVAFFGQWWPTVHNTATEFLKPVGELFMQFQNTFGQTWLLFTNPVGYAQQIIQGQYAKNELGVEGAYGLEIRKFQVQSIYIDEPFMIEIELENKGMYKAKNIRVDVMTNIEMKKGVPLFKISLDGNSYKTMKYAYEDKYEKKWYKFTLCSVKDTNCEEKILNDMERGEVTPIVLYGKVSCEDFDETTWREALGKEHTAREYYISFVVNVTYEYEAESNLQIDFISNDEWKRLSVENKLSRENRPSLISTSPASLNLGTMDQPIKEDSPFFIGFNLTTTWPQKTLVSGGSVSLVVPKEFGKSGIAISCSKNPKINEIPDYWIYIFDLSKSESKSVFCNYDGLRTPLKVPKKTFLVSANATYNFSKWESKDTLFNFRDVCFAREEAEEVMKTPGKTPFNPYNDTNLQVFRDVINPSAPPMKIQIHWNDATQDEKKLFINQNLNKDYYFKGIIGSSKPSAFGNLEDLFVYDPNKKLGYDIDNNGYVINSNGETVCFKAQFFINTIENKKYLSLKVIEKAFCI